MINSDHDRGEWHTFISWESGPLSITSRHKKPGVSSSTGLYTRALISIIVIICDVPAIFMWCVDSGKFPEELTHGFVTIYMQLGRWTNIAVNVQICRSCVVNLIWFYHGILFRSIFRSNVFNFIDAQRHMTMHAHANIGWSYSFLMCIPPNA